jgi:peptide-methionine (S)-S-oxide reductase
MTPHQATFAAGCFWGVEAAFRKLPGVLDAVCGYTGGYTESPTYQQVCSGTTGHAEAVLVTYNPEEISYTTLLEAFFKMHDATQLNRQGPDIGTQYRSAIFAHTQAQYDEAKAMLDELNQSQPKDRPVVTQLVQATVFYLAEEYHQRYFEKHGQSCHF